MTKALRRAIDQLRAWRSGKKRRIAELDLAVPPDRTVSESNWDYRPKELRRPR
jgi:hypothetical protein